MPAHMAALTRARHRRRSTCWWSTCTRSRRPSRAPTARSNDAIENIDIGGPAMLRAAAKNWQDVGGGDRPGRLRAGAGASSTPAASTRATKFALAKKVFAHTAAYDGMITNYLDALHARRRERSRTRCRRASPTRRCSTCSWRRRRTCATARTRTRAPRSTASASPRRARSRSWTQLQGKELSYNNIADADAAWECVKTFDARRPA